MQKREPSYTVGGNADQYSHYGEQCGDSLQIELPYDPESYTYTPRKPELKGNIAPIFTAALFIIARTWKQPTCPSTDEWIRKQWYIYIMEYYSAIKKEFI